MGHTLSPRRRLPALAALSAVAAWPAVLSAQTTIAPLVAGGDPEYQVRPIPVGPFRIEPSLAVDAIYDSNVLADPVNEIDDVEVLVRPALAAAIGDQNTRMRIQSYYQASRFLDLTTENSDVFGITMESLWSPRTGNVFTAGAGFQRIAEDRGDPEAREAAALGPRLTDTIYSTLGFRKEDGRILLDVDGEIREFNALDDIDRERDFVSYAGRATVGLRIGGSMYATAGGFVNRRDFRLEATPAEPNRDSVTYGGRLGVRWIGEGPIQGSAAVGAFRYEPDDGTLGARTGLSIAANVSALPTRRLAIVLDAFRGDVATYRQGASARTDTRFAVSVQQEIRHNFFARYGASWRRTNFVGSGISEEAYGPNFALEWLVNRNVSLVADAGYRKRESDDPIKEFERFRAGLSLRLRI